MAVRTKRAKMLYKLMYLLGPDHSKYLKDEGNEPLSFTKAVIKTLDLYGYPYWNSPNKAYKQLKSQLTIDYLNFMERISDNTFLVFPVV